MFKTIIAAVVVMGLIGCSPSGTTFTDGDGNFGKASKFSGHYVIQYPDGRREIVRIK